MPDPIHRRAVSPWPELAAMSGLLGSYIWLWQGAFPGHFLLCVALYVLIGLVSHRRRGETLAEVGFRTDNLARGALQVVVAVGPLVLAALAAGLWLGSLRPAALSAWPLDVAARIVWGTSQQYGLVGVYYRRCRDLLGPGWGGIVAAGAIFALFHLPNPFLTAVTFLAGCLSCWLYRRVPNLWALGLAHGGLSLALSRSLPLWLTGGMRVGPGYWSFLAGLHGG